MLTSINHSLLQNSSFDVNLFKSLISGQKKNKTKKKPPCIRLFDTTGQHIFLAKNRFTQSLGLNLFIHH